MQRGDSGGDAYRGPQKAAHPGSRPAEISRAMTQGRVKNMLAWRSSTAAFMALAALAGHGPAAGQPSHGYSPPQFVLLLSRTLVRSLPDGKTITTRRSYEVRISRAGDGFRVDGKLVDVGVDVPPSLQAFAEIERRRPDNGLFPITLDGNGMIAAPGGPEQSAAVGQAANLLSERIGGTGLSALDMLQAQAFVARLRSGSARSQWPDDVFRPALGRRSESRTIALPEGREGQVLIEVEGQGAGPQGQVAAVDRIVTTDLGGDRRVTRERWQISRYTASGER